MCLAVRQPLSCTCLKKEKRKFEKVFSRLSKLCTSCAINGTGRPRSVSRFGREAQPEGPPEAILVAQPDSPSEHERKIHRLTHVPFAPWCEFCTSGKARQDHHRRDQSSEKEGAGMIQMGNFFLAKRNKEKI